MRLALILLAAPLFAANYYIATTGNDSNPCSLASPCLTIQHVQGLVTSGDNVYLRGGTYVIASTLAFTSSQNGTTWTSYPGESAIISGGSTITGWSVFAGSGTSTIYRSNTGVPANFLQLYVNGVHAIRARGALNPGGWTRTSTGFISATDMSAWGNPTDIVIAQKGTFRLEVGPIALIVGTAITMATPYWTNNPETGIPYYVENAFELLDAAEEWYLDRSTGYVYYRPTSGSMSGLTVVAPSVGPELVTITGASGIQFSGLTFSYSNWLSPGTTTGYTGRQSGYTVPPSNVPTPGAIHLSGSTTAAFTHCEFTGLGSRGILVDGGSQYVQILSSRFDEIAGGAMQLGQNDDFANSNPATQNRNFTVQDNYFSPTVSFVYTDQGSVFAAYVANTAIDRNEISGSFWSPISVGWGWGLNSSYMAGNSVTNNYVHNFCTIYPDCGGLYTNNSQSPGGTYVSGMAISGNSVSGGNSASGCFYPDEGSAWETWSANTCQTTPKWAFIWINSIHDLILSGNWSDTSSITNAGVNITLTNNTTVTTTVWPLAATLGPLCVSGVSSTPGVPTYSASPPQRIAGACNNHAAIRYWPSWGAVNSRGLLAYPFLGEGSGSAVYDPVGGIATSWTGTPAYTWGPHGWAATFDGSTNSVVLGNNLALLQPGTAPFSISVWVKPTSAASTKAIYFCYIGTDGNAAVQLQITSAGVITARYRDTSGNSLFSTGTTNLFGGWHLVTWVRLTQTTAQLYIDGGADTSGASNGSMGTISDTASGANYYNYVGVISPFGGGGGNFLGQMRDLRFYNRALSVAEIKDIYNLGR